MGDGQGSQSKAGSIRLSTFQTGAMVFGSVALGGGCPYYEFHAPKQQASELARQIIGGLALILDAALPLPVFGVTASAAQAFPDRAIVVHDVILSYATTGGIGTATNLIVVGWGNDPNPPPFRATNHQTTINPAVFGEQGDEVLFAESRFIAGQLEDNLPHSKNPDPGNHVLFHDNAMTFWFDQDAPPAQIFRPFERVQPFLLPENTFFYVGQTDFAIGTEHGSSSKFACDVVWTEIPT